MPCSQQAVGLLGGKHWRPDISGREAALPFPPVLCPIVLCPIRGPGRVLRMRGPPRSEWPLSHPLDVSSGARRVTALSLSFSTDT